MTIYNIGKYGSAFRRLVATAAALALFATQLPLDVAAQSAVSENRESIASAVSPSCDVVGRSLTLEDCRRMALENNASVKNAALDLRAASLQKQEALAEYFPRVSASALGYWALNPLLEIGVTDILGHSDLALNIRNELESYGSLYGINTTYRAFQRGYSASVMALQPLYAGGRIVTGNRLAALGIEAAQLKSSLQQRTTTEEVDELWWQTVSLEDKIEVLDYLDTTLDTLYSSLAAAIASGLAAETDILTLDHKRNELAAAKKKAASGLRLSRMNLFNAIGQPYSLTAAASTAERPFLDSLRLDSVSDLPKEPDFYWKDEEETVASMEESRLLELQVKAKELERRMAIGEALPQVAVGASAGYSDLYSKARSNVVAFATVKVPLSDWGKTARKAQRIGTEVEKARNDRDYLSRQLRLQRGKLWLDLTAAYDSWQLAIQAQENSRRLYETALSNYAAGLIPLQDLLSAETLCRTDASAAVDALIEYREAILAYNRGE